jgi:ATP-dependent DNA helicase RecG
MDRALKRLGRVLDLEKQQGYQNKAVVGGIRQFAAFWVGQAEEEAIDEADKALVQQIGEVLSGYGQLPGAAARAKAIDTLVVNIERRKQRVGSAAAAPGQPAVPSPGRPSAPPLKPVAPPPPAPEPAPAARPAELPAPRVEPEPEPSVAERDLADEFEVEEAAEPEPADEPEEDIAPTGVPSDPVGLNRPVSSLRGVGPKIAEKLERLGATTIWELLYLFPRRYDDYSLMKPISKLTYGEQVTVIGTIWQTRARRVRTNQVVVESIIKDGTGSIQATWFNQPWIAEQLPAGMQVVLSGKVDIFLGRHVFNAPEFEPLELEPLRTRRIVPVYPLTEGLQPNKLRELMQRTVREWAPRVPDPLPEEIRQRRRLYPLPAAIQQMHFPDTASAANRARRRLAFDELFLLQLGMQGQRREWQAHGGAALVAGPEHLEAFLAQLPYQLTAAQQRVVGEIVADMSQERPMNRLLQGDVGSGKTVVAAAAMVVAARAGAQAALMAPTEILAEQHFKGLSRLLEPLGIPVALLTGSTPAAERGAIYEGLGSGAIQVVIGTHALIQPAVTFKRLGLAVIDEQHRFGVDQRAALREKGPSAGSERVSPHLLVMSATPIPRTLALSLYGDLDLSVLDEMPPGRQEIKTRWLRPTESERAYRFIQRQVAEGRQAYVVFPLVEESDSIEAKAAVEEYERLQNVIFPDLRVGLIHGRMRPDEKDAAMRAFSSGETQVLVATSVIEVGVDVPNSTVMVIEGADRFGLAQLHQFRGRVGRGEHQSYCVLIAAEASAETEQRLTALESTNDGFLLAEKDLELRGPGEFFGRRQSGLPALRHASLLHDSDVMQMAQEEAAALFEVDPELSMPEHRLLREHVAQFWQRSGDVS